MGDFEILVAERSSLEIYRGEAEPDLEAIGIRQGMYSRRSWLEGGVPGPHGGPGPDFVKVRPGETIVIADRPADRPDFALLPKFDPYLGSYVLSNAEPPLTRRLMLLEVPPRIWLPAQTTSAIASPGYAMRPKAAVE